MQKRGERRKKKEKKKQNSEEEIVSSETEHLTDNLAWWSTGFHLMCDVIKRCMSSFLKPNMRITKTQSITEMQCAFSLRLEQLKDNYTTSHRNKMGFGNNLR
eukprot:TRINITY_DN100_c0_g1_i22.p1 TRINITY_DN100_c0_g1~~TRINITY_DN100_c0_g1_i22.p1  ORF type:complete len:102 (-),score=6.51 TRINITY_DN100_c0_g1_i22:845-1150(-)